ncbi:MAG: hypothetical protein HYV07_27320 [Deltaproteobacteria bacterium]|nr:hypothetical protein [Deltaproteobacteria bacterium]
MEPQGLVLLALVAGFTALVFERIFMPSGLISDGVGPIPRQLSVVGIPREEFPSSAQRQLDFLTEKLVSLGFVRAEACVKVPGLESFARKVFVVPFVHEAESALFLMIVESGLLARSDLMLHILTPLRDGRRVETTTLGALSSLHASDPVDLRIVLDADSVQEIWSRHRRALLEYERQERAPVSPSDWRALVSRAYENWLQIAVRAQRLSLSKDGRSYRVRSRPLY